MAIVQTIKTMDRKLLALAHILLVFVLQSVLYLYSRKLEKIPLLTTILHAFLLLSTILIHAVHLQPAHKVASSK